MQRWLLFRLETDCPETERVLPQAAVRPERSSLLAGRFEKLNQERRSQLKLLNETLAASAPKALCSMAEESSTYRGSALRLTADRSVVLCGNGMSTASSERAICTRG
jgi:hypothetical protein